MCAAGVILINILQLYNWTNKRFIQVILIFYFLQQFLGYITPLPYIPRCQWALLPKYYYPVGLAMLILGVLDIWIFFFNLHHIGPAAPSIAIRDLDFGGCILLMRSPLT